MDEEQGKKPDDDLTYVNYLKQEDAKEKEASKKKPRPTTCPKCGAGPIVAIGSDGRSNHCQQCGHDFD